MIPAIPRLIDRLTGPPDPLAALLFDATTDGLLVVDLAGDVRRSNARAQTLLDGITPTGPAVGLFAAEDRVAVQAALTNPGGTPGRVRLAVPAERTVTLSVIALREGDGSVSGLLLRLTDATAETRLAQDDRLRTMGQLAGGIAHDFNNLLTAIRGEADSALERPDLDPAIAANLRQVCFGAERGAALVRRLLSFGRPPQRQTIAVNAAVSQMAALLRRLLGTSIRLELALAVPEPHVAADPAQLDQILVNLMVNARDAMPNGGTLTLRTGHQTVDHPETQGGAIVPPGRYARIEVRDTGVGIPPEILPRIFEPFFTTRRERGGSGYGLATVAEAARQSGGFVSAESVLGQGTTLCVLLPLHDGPDAAKDSPAPAASPEPLGTGGVVLLVEDEATIRSLAEQALRRAGWDVLAVEMAEAALALAAQAETPAPDLLISDVVLPGMDGPALLAELRRRWPELPAILVSGYTDSTLRDDLASAGVVFLPKPYSLKALVAEAAAVGTGRVHE